MMGWTIIITDDVPSGRYGDRQRAGSVHLMATDRRRVIHRNIMPEELADFDPEREWAIIVANRRR